MSIGIFTEREPQRRFASEALEHSLSASLKRRFTSKSPMGLTVEVSGYELVSHMLKLKTGLTVVSHMLKLRNRFQTVGSPGIPGIW